MAERKEWKSHTHVLDFPIDADTGSGKKFEVTIREPDVAAIEAIEELGLTTDRNPTAGELRVMIAACSDLTHREAGRLHRDDFGALADALAPLLDGSSETGESEAS